jgi:hypothetical protein
MATARIIVMVMLLRRLLIMALRVQVMIILSMP